jgi:hypothetical protein
MKPMTLQELHDQLAPLFPVSVQKDVHTAVRVLAQALQCPDPQHCPFDQWNQPLPTLYQRVETYLRAQGKSAHTLRNTKNNLSRLWRLAETQKVFTPIPLVLTPRYDPRTKPHRPGSDFAMMKGRYLRFCDWPPALQESFTTFATWASAPLVPGRDAKLRKRAVTVGNYRINFEAYFGFLHHIQQLPIPTLTFDQLFDITLVTAYVHWHVNELHHKPTKAIYMFLQRLLSLTNQYRLLPELREQLRTLFKTLPFPSPTFNKEEVWIPLATLDEIGRALWPGRLPHEVSQTPQHPGRNFALHAGYSLIFRLWRYIPLRSRNMREMKLEENLRKDADGRWRLTFRDEQLKVASKRGRPNIFDVPFPPALVPHLEAYLNVWRPLLLKQATHPSSCMFLSRFGTPYNLSTFHRATSEQVYRYTGKRWHPHIVRTVWATEWIRSGGDFLTAAKMLNDTLETVIANYAHLRDYNVAEEVYDVLDRRNGQGK